MIGEERRCRLQRTRICARVSPRLLAPITKAGTGSEALRFISQRGAASKKKEETRRRRRRVRPERPRPSQPREAGQGRGEVFLLKAARGVVARTPGGPIDFHEKCCAPPS